MITFNFTYDRNMVMVYNVRDKIRVDTVGAVHANGS